MSGVLVLRNRQRARPIDTRYLRRIIQSVLQDELWLNDFEIGVYLVGVSEMIRVNETYLKHAGPTDVISFNYGSDASNHAICGELIVCVAVAVSQGRRFRTTWQSELVRYIIHGTLHLIGYDDLTARARHRMKSEEDRLVRRAANQFSFSRVRLKP